MTRSLTSHGYFSHATPKMPKAAIKKSSPIKTKAKKDPNAPKKPLSAFMFFSQENRQKVKDENPDATFGSTY